MLCVADARTSPVICSATLRIVSALRSAVAWICPVASAASRIRDLAVDPAVNRFVEPGLQLLQRGVQLPAEPVVFALQKLADTHPGPFGLLT